MALAGCTDHTGGLCAEQDTVLCQIAAPCLASRFDQWLMSTGPCCAVTYILMTLYTIRVDVYRTPLRGDLQPHDPRVHSTGREMCVTAKCSSSQEGVMK